MDNIFMKTMIAFCFAGCLCFLISCTGNIKESKLPSTVSETFRQKFPAASHISWSRENDSTYEAEFSNEGKASSALIDLEGDWIETETAVGSSELPLVVIQTVASGFQKFRIKGAEFIETPDEGKFYELIIKNKQEAFEIRLSESGVILKKEIYTGEIE
jgi:hypothetical protein